jgi:hypothetical protein
MMNDYSSAGILANFCCVHVVLIRVLLHKSSVYYFRKHVTSSFILKMPFGLCYFSFLAKCTNENFASRYLTAVVLRALVNSVIAIHTVSINQHHFIQFSY